MGRNGHSEGTEMFPKEIYDFVKHHSYGIKTPELQVILKEKFGRDYTVAQLKSYRKHIKAPSGEHGGGPRAEQGTKLWPKEVYEFVKFHSRGIDNEHMVDVLREKFGIERSIKQITAYRKNIRAPSGVSKRFGSPGGNKPGTGFHFPNNGCFEKGHTPYNKLPVGTITKKEGYLFIKYKDDDTVHHRFNWMLLSRYIMMQENGKLDAEQRVIFLDGNSDNVSLDNLETTTNNVLGAMNGSKFKPKSPEAKRAFIRLLGIRNEVRKLERNGRPESDPVRNTGEVDERKTERRETAEGD